jgi:hypothetical protein
MWKGRYWARWSDAVREAGYDPEEMTQKIPEENILEKLAGLITKLGYFPVRDEINMHARMVPGFPVWETICRRFAVKPIRLSGHARERIESPGATEAEVAETIRAAPREQAQGGRLECQKDFSFGRD